MRGAGVLYIEKGQYYLLHSESDLPAPPSVQAVATSLMFPDARGLGVHIRPMTFDGPMGIEVETFDVEPSAVHGWEHQEECSGTASGFDLAVATLFYGTALPRLLISPTQRYRVRLYARGLVEAERQDVLGADDEPIEHHMLHLWRERQRPSPGPPRHRSRLARRWPQD